MRWRYVCVSKIRGQKATCWKKCMHAAACGASHHAKIEGEDIFQAASKDAVQDGHKTPKTIPQHHDYKQLGLNDESAGLLPLNRVMASKARQASQDDETWGGGEPQQRLGDRVLRSHAPSTATTTATTTFTTFFATVTTIIVASRAAGQDRQARRSKQTWGGGRASG